MGSGAPNGSCGGAVAVRVAGRLPVLVTEIVALAWVPNGTEPKLTAVGDAVNLLTPFGALPVSVTAAAVPAAPVTLNGPPGMVILLIFCAAVPPLVMITVVGASVPTGTLPNENVCGFA